MMTSWNIYRAHTVRKDAWFGLRISQLLPLRPDTTAWCRAPFSTDGARTPALQTNAKYVGRLLARCATPTPMRWRNTRMADRSARIADWRALRVRLPDDTLRSTTKQRPLHFSRDTYHPMGVSTITSEKLHRVALRRRLTGTAPTARCPPPMTANSGDGIRRRRSGKRTRASKQPLSSGLICRAPSGKVWIAMRLLPADATLPIEFHASAPGLECDGRIDLIDLNGRGELSANRRSCHRRRHQRHPASRIFRLTS